MPNNDQELLKTENKALKEHLQEALRQIKQYETRMKRNDDRVKQLEGKIERMGKQLLRAENRCDVYQRFLHSELLRKDI